jgi:hypothetical protein
MSHDTVHNICHTVTFFEYFQTRNAHFHKFICCFNLVTANIYAGHHGMTLP